MAAEQKVVESTAEEILQKEDHLTEKEEASVTSHADHSARAQREGHSAKVEREDHHSEQDRRESHLAKDQREEVLESVLKEEASETESQADSE